eukprot:Gb_41046 [translate_table: standard]
MDSNESLVIVVTLVFPGSALLILLVIIVLEHVCRQAELRQAELFREQEEINGLSSGEIKSLEQLTYNAEKYNGLRLHCSVCLSNISEGEVFRILPDCRHHFHLGCIDQWLSRHGSCPNCRKRVNTRRVDHTSSPLYGAGSVVSEEDNATVCLDIANIERQLEEIKQVGPAIPINSDYINCLKDTREDHRPICSA